MDYSDRLTAHDVYSHTNITTQTLMGDKIQYNQCSKGQAPTSHPAVTFNMLKRA